MSDSRLQTDYQNSITAHFLRNQQHGLGSQVPVKKNLGQVERTQTAFDFDLERRLLLEQSTGESTFAPMDPATVHDPYDEAMEPYLQMGLLVRRASLF